MDSETLSSIIRSLEEAPKASSYSQLNQLLHETSKKPQLATNIANALTSRATDLLSRLLSIFERDVGASGSTNRVGQAMSDKEKDQLYVGSESLRIVSLMVIHVAHVLISHVTGGGRSRQPMPRRMRTVEAMRALGEMLHSNAIALSLGGQQVERIIKMLLRRVTRTSNRSIATMTSWTLSIQNIPGEHLVVQLEEILEGVKYILNQPTWSSSNSLQIETLQALSKLLSQLNTDMKREAMLIHWLPCVFPRLLHAEPRIRDKAWMLLSSVSSSVKVPPLSISQALFAQMPQSILKSMNDIMLQDTQAQSTATAAAAANSANHNNNNGNAAAVINTDMLQTLLKVWGRFVLLLGSCLFKDNLINAFLKIPEKTFLHPSAPVRLLTLDVWTSLMDHFGNQKGGLLVAKRLKLIMTPLLNCMLTDRDLSVRRACLTTWRYLLSSVIRASPSVPTDLWVHLAPPALVTACTADHALTADFVACMMALITQTDTFVVTANDALQYQHQQQQQQQQSTSSASASATNTTTAASAAAPAFPKMEWMWSVIQQIVSSKSFEASSDTQRSVSELGKLLIHRMFHSGVRTLTALATAGTPSSSATDGQTGSGGWMSPPRAAASRVTLPITSPSSSSSSVPSSPAGSSAASVARGALATDFQVVSQALHEISKLPCSSLVAPLVGGVVNPQVPPPRLDLIQQWALTVVETAQSFTTDFTTFVGASSSSLSSSSNNSSNTASSSSPSHNAHLLCQIMMEPLQQQQPQQSTDIVGTLLATAGVGAEATSLFASSATPGTTGSFDMFSQLVHATTMSLIVLSPSTSSSSHVQGDGGSYNKRSGAVAAAGIGAPATDAALERVVAFALQLLRQLLALGSQLPVAADSVLCIDMLLSSLKRIVSGLIAPGGGSGFRGGDEGPPPTTTTTPQQLARSRLARACLQCWRCLVQASSSLLDNRSKELIALSRIKVALSPSVAPTAPNSSVTSASSTSDTADTPLHVSLSKVLTGALGVPPAFLVASLRRVTSREQLVTACAASPAVLGDVLADWKTLYQGVLRVIPQQGHVTHLSLSGTLAVRIDSYLRKCSSSSGDFTLSIAGWYTYAQLLVPLMAVVVDGVKFDNVDWKVKASASRSARLPTSPPQQHPSSSARGPKRAGGGKPRSLFASESEHNTEASERQDPFGVGGATAAVLGEAGAADSSGVDALAAPPLTSLSHIVQAVASLSRASLSLLQPQHVVESDVAERESAVITPFNQCAEMMEQLVRRLTSGGSGAKVQDALVAVLKVAQDMLQPAIGSGGGSASNVESFPAKCRETAQRVWTTLMKATATIIKPTPAVCDSALLESLAPVFLTGLSSKHRTVKNATIELWQATFGSLPATSTTLNYPPALEELFSSVLDKMGTDVIKLPGFRPVMSFPLRGAGAAAGAGIGGGGDYHPVDSLGVEPYTSPSLAFPVAHTHAKVTSEDADMPGTTTSSSSNNKKRKGATTSTHVDQVSDPAMVKVDPMGMGDTEAKRRKTTEMIMDVVVQPSPSLPVLDDEHAWTNELDALCNPARVNSVLPGLTTDDIARAQAKLLSVLTLLNERLLP